MEKIIESNLLDQYTKDMISYAIGVNRRRSIPEARDGFKPVQRRILFTTHELNLVEPKLKKSSKIVGDTMGNYHPHGDSSIYDAMPLMGNTFDTKIPLLYLNGNWGTVMGDEQAAMRYTECSLSKFADRYIIGELNKTDNVVDWEKNFDDSKKEPVYLPVQLPILLINGASGIGVGLACDIPRHNPIEVIDTTLSLIQDIIDKKDRTTVMLIPDQCQKTEIIETNFKEICDTGEGKFVVRGIVEIGEYEKYPALFIRSLPDRVYFQDVIDSINEMIDKKQLTMIRDIGDISENGVSNVVIQLNKDSNPQYVRDILYKRTNIEKSFTVDMELVEDITPKKFNYKEYLLHWITHRCITKKRLYTAKKYTVDTKLHKISTYIQVLRSGDIDYIIDKIKKNTKDDEAELIEFMIKKYGFTDIQCNFILNTSIRYLSLARLRAYEEEQKELQEESIYYENKILDHSLTLQDIKEELLEIREYINKDKNLRTRNTRIIKAGDDIPAGDFLLAITDNNYIRKLPVVSKVNDVKGDHIKYLIKIDNRDSVLFFDNKGKVFRYPVHKIPLCGKSEAGIIAAGLIKNMTADILTILPNSVIEKALKMERKPFFVVTTESKISKRLQMEDFANISTAGMIYTKLATPEDKVVDVILSDESSDIVFYSGRRALRLPVSDIPLYRRSAQGVIAMKSADNTPMEGIGIIYPDTDSIVVVTENGKINRISVSALEVGKRGLSGSSVIKLGKTDRIFKIFGVNQSYTLKVGTTLGVYEIPVADIPCGTSASMGAKLIPMRGNKIIRVEVVR